MSTTIAFIGVHGSGKTTTARFFNKYGFRSQSVEAIHKAFGLEPIQRQTLFFTTYVSSYLSGLNENKNQNIVFDSHPLIVLPYTEYWLLKGGFPKNTVDDVVMSFLNIVLMLPKVDLMVYLKGERIDIIIDRILKRARFSTKEEANAEYIAFIDKKIQSYLAKYGDRIAKNLLVVDASIELFERAKLIEEWLINNKFALIKKESFENKFLSY